MAESIHLEIGLFLQKLKSYLAKSKNQQNHALTAVSLLLSDYEEHTFQNPEKTDIRFFLQDANIEIKRNAFCRRCDKSFEMNEAAFKSHFSSDLHQNGGTTAKIQQQCQGSSVVSAQKTSSLNDVAKMKLLDSPKSSDVFELAKVEVNNLLTRSKKRIKAERKIIETVSKYIKANDERFNVYQYGSSTYGFGGSVDLNILVDTSRSGVIPQLALHEFKKLIDKNDFSDHFTDIIQTHADRVIAQQLKMIHIESAIRCTICFEADQPSALIGDILAIDPLYLHLVAYVKAWQTVLNRQNKKVLFEFNTYTIVVMVIAVLRREFNVPIMDQFSKLQQPKEFPQPKRNFSLSELFKGFLLFFTKYERHARIISPFVPRFINIRKDPQQKNVPPDEKLIRDHMKANPNNWKNCSMFIQDPIKGLNITAEIPEKNVIAFQHICREFHEITKKGKLRISMEIKKDPQPSPSSASTSLASDRKRQMNINKSQSKECAPGSSNLPSNINNIFEYIEDEAKNYLNRSNDRIQAEKQIMQLITGYAKSYNSNFNVYQHGSTTYGFGGSVDLNILIDTGKPEDIAEDVPKFKKFIDIADCCENFDKSVLQQSNRVIGQHIKIIHTKTKLRCTIQLTTNPTPTIVGDILKKNGSYLCLVAYIKAWQSILNQINKNPLFYFNTYTIAIMAIAVQQRKSKIPTINEIPNWLKSAKATHSENIREMLMEFFIFYGEKYERKNHVISPFKNRFIYILSDLSTDKAAELLHSQAKAKPDNWKNCSLFIQDLTDFSVNITAEIPETEASTFQRLCLDCHKILSACQYIFRPMAGTSINKVSSAPLAETKNVANCPKYYGDCDDLSEKRILNATADLLARTSDRIGWEEIILRTLKSALMGFDSMLEITPFGSSVYGFGGAKTNFNLFINASKSSQHNTNDLIESLRTYLRLPRFINDFKEIKYIPRNRVLKPQLIISHKISNIECVLISEDSSLIKVTKLIENYNNIEPMCLRITAVVKAVQLITNAFEFNSYIINVLVIFFLQMKYGLPKTINLQAEYTNPNKELGSLLYEFFHFYAVKYQNACIISARFGRWQQRRLGKNNKIVSLELKKLRNNIDQHPQNWDSSCAMYVQDLVRLEINIAAEVSSEDFVAFQQICVSLAKKFDGIWNKADKVSTSENECRLSVAGTDKSNAKNHEDVNKESMPSLDQEDEVLEVVGQQDIDRDILLQSLSELENGTDEETESSLAEDFEELQIFSSNETLVHEEKQMSAKNSALPADKLESGDDSSVQSYKSAELLQVDPNISDSDHIEPKSSVANSLDHELTEAKACVVVPTEPADDNNLIETELKFETELGIQNSDAAYPEAAEPSNEAAAICNTITPRSVLSRHSIEILSYVRTNVRVLEEAEILETLKKYMSAFDKNTCLSCVGSVFYKITSQKSDLNILVTTANSSQSDTAYNLFKTRLNGSNSVFKSIETFSTNQVQKSHIRMVHKVSGIRCSLHFNSQELGKSAEIILQLIKFNPMVGPTITRIRAWQQSINNISRIKFNGLPYFEFNTYTIAILVIFSFQMDSLLPPMNLIGSMLEDNKLKNRTEIDRHQLSSCLFAFFNLYGNEFKMNENVISVKSGHWLDYQLEVDNAFVSPLQKRLCEEMENNPENWAKCAMYMQDIFDTGRNVTAQVPKNSAEQFQQMCKMFAAKEYCDELAILI